MTAPIVQASADISDSADLGTEVTVWHLAQIRDGARVGDRTIVGRGAYIGSHVQIGSDCKIQNYALVYEPAILERGVFVGPAAVLTNDQYPRATNPDLSQKSSKDWQPVGVHVCEGAAIGAQAVCVAPVRIGRWATVAAGAVVTGDVPDFALVAGVPARRIGWVSKTGRPLQAQGAAWVCQVTGDRFVERDGLLVQMGANS